MDLRLALLIILLAGHVAGLWIEARLNRKNLEILLDAGGEISDPGLMYALYGSYAMSLPFMIAFSFFRGSEAPPAENLALGFALVAAAHGLRRWAIVSLGYRWSMSLVKLMGTKPLNAGPYRALHNPEYLSRNTEIIGFALVTGAWVVGAVALVLAGALSWRARRREDDLWTAASLAWEGAIK